MCRPGDWRSYTNHVDNDPDDHHPERERVLDCPRERYHEAVHKEVNRNSVKWSPQQPLPRKEFRLSRDHDEDGCGAIGNHKVNQQPQSCNCASAGERTRAHHPGCDSLQQTKWLEPEMPVNNQRCRDVQSAADQAAPQDRLQRL